MKKIVVLGSFVTDLVARMPRFPSAGESVIGTSFSTFLGGKGANQCVAIKRLKGEVTMIGEVGKDLFGDNFLKLFEEEGIDTSYILRTDKASTGVGNVQIEDSGQNRICIILGANLEFTLTDLEKVKDIILKHDIFLTQFEMREDVTLEAIKFAKEHGLLTIVNPAPARKIKEEYLKYIDYLTPNEYELGLLTDMPTTNLKECLLASKKLCTQGVKNVITTWGSKGAILVNDVIKAHVHSYKVKPIDTVGAGDSFNGALARSLADNKDIISSVKFGNAMGALTTTKRGAIPSLHTLEEVEAFIDSNPEIEVTYL